MSREIPVKLFPEGRSSNIAGFGYDEASRILRVRFKNGSVYDYFGVDPSVPEAWPHDSSPGKFFFRQVRRQNYPFEKVEEGVGKTAGRDQCLR